MLCPECNHQLSPISLKNMFGTTVLDYCNHCGGVWTDIGEVNFLKENELEPLASVLPKQTNHPTISEHHCPKDRTMLKRLQGESVPTDLDLYQCPECRGVWFPEKALFRFKKAQRTKLDYYKEWKIPLHSMYAILLPLFLFAILSGGLIFTIIGFKQGADVRTRATAPFSQPLVLSPVAGQVLISFTTETPTLAKIKYWKIPEKITEIWVSPTAQTTHTVILKNLDPGSTYTYQISITEPTSYESPVYTFEVRTQ